MDKKNKTIAEDIYQTHVIQYNKENEDTQLFFLFYGLLRAFEWKYNAYPYVYI